MAGVVVDACCSESSPLPLHTLIVALSDWRRWWRCCREQGCNEIISIFTGSSKRIRTSPARNSQNTSSYLERESCQLLPFTRKDGGSLSPSYYYILVRLSFTEKPRGGNLLYRPSSKGWWENWNQQSHVWRVVGIDSSFSFDGKLYLLITEQSGRRLLLYTLHVTSMVRFVLWVGYIYQLLFFKYSRH